MLNTLRRQARNLTTVVGLIGALILGLGTPAFASSWAFQDGFESNPAASWWFQSSGGAANGTFDPTDGMSHTGFTYGTVWRFGAGWVGVGRTVHLTPADSHRSTCVAQVWLQESPGYVVNIEVINPASWTYIALKQVTLPDSNWHAYTTSTWVPGPVDVVFRVSALNSGDFSRVKVDDVTIQCAY